MKIRLATFATPNMHRSAILCGDSALLHGASWFWEYDPVSPALTGLYGNHHEILSNPRGAGFWLWKPAIVLDAMSHIGKGDVLIYADAGIEFIDNVNHIISRMDQDIFLFGNNWEHAHWCKRDVVEVVWPLNRVEARIELSMIPISERVNYDLDSVTWSRFGKQVQASVIFFRVSGYTRRFVKEWLDWCLFEGGRLIDDSPSRLPNHPEFREHRHDQAILTTMAYREGIKLHYWPAMYNDGAFTYEKLPEYAGDDYPSPLFHHHRKRNHEWGNAI